MKQKAKFLFLLGIVNCQLSIVNSQEHVVPFSFGDMDHWVVREIHESGIIGGNTKHLYELGPTDTIIGNTAYTNRGGSPWANSNVMAKVAGVVKTNTSVFPERRDDGWCARLETRMESVKVFGLVDIEVVAAGSVFLGTVHEPIKGTKNPQAMLNSGVAFTKKPKALRFDYKVKLAPEKDRIRSTGFSRKTTVAGQDSIAAILLLQKRWEDKDGNIYSKRVGTMVQRYTESSNGWVNDATYPILYGDITKHPEYKPYMRIQVEERYALNSQGKSVPIQEVGWAAEGELPTHIVLQFTSSHGGAYIGSPGNTMWIDNVMKELQVLEEAHPEYADPHSPTQRVGSDLSKEFEQVVHKYPMLSLGNTYSEDEVKDFYERIARDLNEPFEIVAELKYDGTSISLTYEDGRLVRAVTRGDGTRGDDVTANVKTIRSVPLKLMGDRYPATFEIRGEILLPWAEFDRLNKEREEQEEPLFANPRNAASGTLKQQNPAVVAARKLDAYFYYLLGEELPAETHFDNLEAARSWGFKIPNVIRVCNSLEDIYDYIAYWDVERKNLPVATDGIVLKVNSLLQQRNLGFTAKSPRWVLPFTMRILSKDSTCIWVTRCSWRKAARSFLRLSVSMSKPAVCWWAIRSVSSVPVPNAGHR